MCTKANKKLRPCPICGKESVLTLHHILPRFIFKEITSEDRDFFLNGHNSYWMCRECHDKYEDIANTLRLQLLNDNNYPEDAYLTEVLNRGLKKVKNLCRCMTGKYRTNVYNYSIYEAYNFVKNYYNKEYLAYHEIEELSEIFDRIPNEKYINPGIFLIENIGVENLDIIYRQNLNDFLKNRNVKNLIKVKNSHYEI